MEKAKQKTISLAIIGKPNAGKSSLLNKLIGQKISIVTPKVQTTRSIITGIVTLNDTQLIILDTPGIFQPKKKLEKAMVRCAWSSLHSADIILLLIDSTEPIADASTEILEKLRHLKTKMVFLLNKIDIANKYLPAIENIITTSFPDARIIKISALSGKNIDKLLIYLKNQAKITPWLYSEDDITNLPMRFLAAEITREQLFLQLYQELPYNLTVQTEIWQKNKDKSVKIHQVIIVSRDTYKTIILGKNGSKIKEIGTMARMEMQNAFDCKIHLFLFVKIREFWENDPDSYNHMRLQQI